MSVFRSASILARLALLAIAVAVLSGASSAYAASEGPPDDILSFLSENGAVLPEDAESELSGLTVEAQIELLIKRGADSEILRSDFETRPMLQVAEILKVMDPEGPSPELASDEAYARKDRDEALHELLTVLDKEYRGRIGYPSRASETSDSLEIVVPVKDLSVDDRRNIEQRDLHPDLKMRAVSVEFSKDELRALKEDVYLALSEQSERGEIDLGHWYVSVNGVDNLVQVGLTIEPGTTQRNTDALLESVRSIAQREAFERFTGRNTDSAVRVLVDEESLLPTIDYRESAHIRGGEWAAADNWIPACTTNFLWKKGSTFRMGTAGHCSTTGGTWQFPRAYRTFDHAKLDETLNGQIGTVQLNGWTSGTRADYALMTLPQAATGLSRVSTTATSWRTVKAVVAENSAGGPFTWCHVGWGMKKIHGHDKRCGPVNQTLNDTSATYTMNDGSSFTIHGLYCFSALTAPGDSGGPVYYENGDDAWAVGIIHSGNGGTSCFTTVQASKDRHGYSVVLG